MIATSHVLWSATQTSAQSIVDFHGLRGRRALHRADMVSVNQRRKSFLNNIFHSGTQTRRQLVTRLPEAGGRLCPDTIVDYKSCFQQQCADCSVDRNGPNGAPCFNGGVCVDETPFDGKFKCQCVGGFIGDNCNTRLSLAELIFPHT